MKSIVILICLLSPVMGISQSLFTWNLKCEDENRVEKVTSLTEFIMKNSPEVVLFQEVCDKELIGELLTELNLRTGLNWKARSIFSHRSYGKFDEYLVTITPHDIEETSFGNLPSSSLSRSYLGIKIRGIFYVNVHLDHRSEDQNDRKRQIEFLLKAFGGKPHVLAGDFNSGPKESEQFQLGHLGFLDLFPGHTYPAELPTETIDGIWLSPEVQSIWQGRVFRTQTKMQKPQDGLCLSDHLGVFLEVLSN